MHSHVLCSWSWCGSGRGMPQSCYPIDRCVASGTVGSCSTLCSRAERGPCSSCHAPPPHLQISPSAHAGMLASQHNARTATERGQHGTAHHNSGHRRRHSHTQPSVVQVAAVCTSRMLPGPSSSGSPRRTRCRQSVLPASGRSIP